MACAPSEDSDQPGHPPSLIRVFVIRMKKAWTLSYPLSAQQRLWSDWVHAQADLSLRWAQSHFVGLSWGCLNFAAEKPILVAYGHPFPIQKNEGHLWEREHLLEEIWYLGTLWYMAFFQWTSQTWQGKRFLLWWMDRTEKVCRTKNHRHQKSRRRKEKIRRGWKVYDWARAWQNQHNDLCIQWITQISMGIRPV